MDLGERPTDAETDALIAELEAAGLVTIGFDAEGHETWTLTPAGAQVARQLATGDDATFNSILDAGGGDFPPGDEGPHLPIEGCRAKAPPELVSRS